MGESNSIGSDDDVVVVVGLNSKSIEVGVSVVFVTGLNSDPDPRDWLVVCR